MSTFNLTGLTKDEYREAFNRAAADNKSYLLILEDVREEVMSMNVETYLRPVNNQSEIVPLLKSLNTLPFYGLSTLLVGVFDLRKDFDEALSARDIDTVLAPTTLADIAQFKKEYGHQRDVQVWESRPWVQRLFIPKPVLEQ